MSNGVAKVGNKSGICNSGGQDFLRNCLTTDCLAQLYADPSPYGVDDTFVDGY